MKDQTFYQNVKFSELSPFVVINHRKSTTEPVASHWHQDLEINWLNDGEVTFFIEGKKTELKPGHLLIINSDTIHSSIPDVASIHKESTGLTLIIKKSFLLSLIPNYENLWFVIDNEDDEQQIIAQLRQISEIEKTAVTSEAYLIIASHVCEILSVMVARSNTIKTDDKSLAKNNQFHRQVISYIHSHYAENLTEKEMAARFHFSDEYFCRLFKKVTGVSFCKYLQTCRVIHAAEMLATGNTPISRIAQESGFSTEQYFNKVFRQNYGMPPGDYRKYKNNQGSKDNH